MTTALLLSTSLPPNGALPQLFPKASIHPVVTPVSLLPTGALPKLFPTVSLPSTLSSLPYRSFPPELSPSYFPRFTPRVHPLVTPVSLLPTGALPKLFPTVSLPSTLSSLPYRSFPPELSPSYFPRFPFRAPCRHSRIAPSQRTSPPRIFHGFPSVHPLVTPESLLPTGPLPHLFPTVSLPSTLSSFPYCSFPPTVSQAICTVSSPSSMLSRSLPAKLSPSYLHGFLSVQHAVSLPPSEALPKLFPRFPIRPACCLAPSQRASLSPSYLHGFLSVQHAVSLSPREGLPKLFARFPVRPESCVAPSHRSSPQAICTACCLAPSQRSSP